MATPNPNDNTQLGTGELVSNEAVGVNDSKGDANLPIVAYKLPRSKIAVGNYGQDGGDATDANPLPVESLLERREAERQMMLSMSMGLDSLRRYSVEYRQGNATLDVRGQLLDTRGKR
jgi:hypothetical protein